MKIILGLVMMSMLTPALFARDLEVIKSEIMDMALSFKGQADVDGRKQLMLEEKVEELLVLVPELTMEQKAIRALGTWNQVWGPYAFDDSSTVPAGIDVDHIYQALYAGGYYYNFAEYIINGERVYNFVRGVFAINQDHIGVRFDQTGVVLEQTDLDYANLGQRIEDGLVAVSRLPDGTPPIGVRGKLVEVFADDDLRINYGVVGADLSKKVIFVMRRVR